MPSSLPTDSDRSDDEDEEMMVFPDLAIHQNDPFEIDDRESDFEYLRAQMQEIRDQIEFETILRRHLPRRSQSPPRTPLREQDEDEDEQNAGNDLRTLYEFLYETPGDNPAVPRGFTPERPQSPPVREPVVAREVPENALEEALREIDEFFRSD